MISRITKTVKTQAFPAYLFLAALLIPSLATAVVTMRMQTDLGSIDIELFDTVAPLTVANFMNYVSDGDYDGTFIHRSVPGFVVQGGGFIFDESAGNFFSGGASHIPTDPAVVNEFNLSNLRGTIAMAKVGGDPDSATSEWFINLADNSANLDNQNGGFTVFAQVLGNGMDVVDAIAALPRCVDTTPFPSQCGQFQDVPFTGVAAGLLTNDQLVNISYIGTDSDGDGVIDNREDAAPNNGDGNNDGIPDKQQPNVASLVDVINGNYVTIAAGATFLLQNVGVSDGSNILLESGSAINLSGLNFIHGFLGYEVKNLDPGGEATVRIYLPDGESPVKYYGSTRKRVGQF